MEGILKISKNVKFGKLFYGKKIIRLYSGCPNKREGPMVLSGLPNLKKFNTSKKSANQVNISEVL